MERPTLGLVAITMRRALEFKISRIGARSIHLRDNIFRSKYEYYIISVVERERERRKKEMLVSLLPLFSHIPRRVFPHSLSTSPLRVFISLLLQSAPLVCLFILLFLPFHLSRCQSECLHYEKNWASLSLSLFPLNLTIFANGRVIDRQEKRVRERNSGADV